VAARPFELGVALAKSALPVGLDRELRARATTTLSLTWRSILDTVISERLIEQTVDRLLSMGVAERIVDRILSGPELDRIVERALGDGRVEALVARAIEHPTADRVVTRIVDNPSFERLVLSIAHSETVDRLLDRVLASEELDRVVTNIAESDEVRGALAEQSFGLADEVAGQLRVRAMAADALLEQFARRVTRRRRAPDSTPSEGGASG
jgi:hypothetical protein